MRLYVVYRLYPTSNHNRSSWSAPLVVLFIVCILHQTTTARLLSQSKKCCLSSVSYIKPQPAMPVPTFGRVVYRLYPTSNHNLVIGFIIFVRLFIVCILHQTTTYLVVSVGSISCLSSVSYIKPQRELLDGRSWLVVYRLYPTSNHNRLAHRATGSAVVYRLYPTSNHNKDVLFTISAELFIVCILHQTTTCALGCCHARRLFIVCILHQTTTLWLVKSCGYSCLSSVSYIKPQLVPFRTVMRSCCLSSVSYIKPQP